MATQERPAWERKERGRGRRERNGAAQKVKGHGRRATKELDLQVIDVAGVLGVREEQSLST